MKARPILFSAPMIRALLEGRKTQTRRIVKPAIVDHIEWLGGHAEPGDKVTRDDIMLSYGRHTNDRGDSLPPEWLLNSAQYPEEGCISIGQGYGTVGDLLWVRETCSIRMSPGDATDGIGRVWYRADSDWGDEIRWRPSIHLPRWASRITLRITDVRVERLQDISEEDAWAEGVQDYMGKKTPWRGRLAPVSVHAYAHLWELINGESSWAANPWVWALTFAVEKRNVDETLREVA